MNDPHATSVIECLRSETDSVLRTSFDDWNSHRVDWDSAGALTFHVDDTHWEISEKTTVWWRRPGVFQNNELNDAELTLAQDEIAVIGPGMFEAAGVRWVDNPWESRYAGNRLVQLRLADKLGVPIPATVVTNRSETAQRLLFDGAVLAKPISTGPGLAPFVDTMTEEDCGLVEPSPVLLQRSVEAKADWRIVVIGSDCFGWRRDRSVTDPIDWRAVDPAGLGFVPAGVPTDTSEYCLKIQEGLGLTFGVLDWLERDEGFCFLEVNPQGQWLFLPDAEEVVSPKLAHHLLASLPATAVALSDPELAERNEKEGTAPKAPTALRQFWWDLLPAGSPDWLVPQQSGLTPPVPFVEWISPDIAEHPDALGLTQRAHDQARQSAVLLESKASSVVNLSLTLLAIALAMLSYEIGYVREHNGTDWYFLLPVSLAIVLLVLTGVSALEIQRVGLYQTNGTEPLGHDPGGALSLVVAEETNRQIAVATARDKADKYLQTRAWLSRALLALLLGALVAAVTLSSPTAEAPPPGDLNTAAN